MANTFTQVIDARKKAKELFFKGKFEGQIRPLSWLVEKFMPLPGWSNEDLIKLKESEVKF